jgi:hypothetical protein
MANTAPDAHAETDANFIPQLARDWQEYRYSDVITSICASPMITAEVALYLWRADPETGPKDALRFLEFIVQYSRY